MSHRILLVHGAWHTARTWTDLAADLRGRGHQVALAELHRGSLSGDIAAAEQAAHTLEGPVVAVGHSYGGSVISGLNPELVSRLVYLAAPMPDLGQSALGLAEAYPTDLSGCLVPGPGSTVSLAPERAGQLLYQQLSPAEQRRHVAELVPQDMTAGHEPAITATWRDRPSTYVVCTEDRTVHPDLQRRLSKQATTTITLDSDHACYLSHAAEIADLLAPGTAADPPEAAA